MKTSTQVKNIFSENPLKTWFDSASDYIRLLPNFLIIGAQKCGTTSLHHYLSAHPYIRCADIKEVHFFDEQFSNGSLWYRSHFPTYARKLYYQLKFGQNLCCGEGTPYYLFHPLAPKRVFETVPNVKLIVLLKNPIDRAYSHYQHERKRNFEPLESFEKALEAEAGRLHHEQERIIIDDGYNSYNYMHYSYLARGRYAEQLRRWFAYFPREQFLILESEVFYKDTIITFQKVLDFLELPYWNSIKFKRYNSNQYIPISQKTRDTLSTYYQKYNQDLYGLLDQTFSWD